MGVDGYIGWPLAQYLVVRGHKVAGIDNYSRRNWVAEIGSQSATPILRMTERLSAFKENFGANVSFFRGNVTDLNFVVNVLRHFKPDAIVHLAEVSSAPYSMMDQTHALFTHSNNLFGTLNILFAMRDVCPNAHLVKLGSMGAYGTPNIDIPEGFFTVEFRGRKDTLPFPKVPGSWYHQTKVHDSNNVMMACHIWGLRSTDVMQGTVYGTRIPEMGDDERLVTRFDFDQCFGTALNRFCAQAVIGDTLTLYGKGSQIHPFLALKDAMQCLALAIENPPDQSDYRVFNQFEDSYSLTDLASLVKRVGVQLGLNFGIRNTENPRIEMEKHHYRADRQRLLELGYRPTRDLASELTVMLKDLIKYTGRILARREALLPDIRWDGSRRPVEFLDEDGQGVAAEAGVFEIQIAAAAKQAL
jgi:UDP-sulfoquinovose synthase